jgi:hypothetical protein
MALEELYGKIKRKKSKEIDHFGSLSIGASNHNSKECMMYDMLKYGGIEAEMGLS